jgi:hypothetical protein
MGTSGSMGSESSSAFQRITVKSVRVVSNSCS